MNLSLYQLKKKLKSNKQAQGGLVAVVLAGLVGSILVSSATSWYLSMRQNVGNVEQKLEAQTIAQSEWERLSHMSLDELEAKRGELAQKYSAGTNSQYQISVNLGQKGTFNGGTCGNIGSDGYANCFKNTTITVYQDGNRLFTTRTLPLMAGDYTRREVDNLLSNLRNDLRNEMDKKLDGMTVKYDPIEHRIKYYKDGKEIDSGTTILTGVVSTGTTLPIPSGYTVDKCAFFVSTNYTVDGVTDDDIYSFNTFIDDNRRARVLMEGRDRGNANYLVICSHGAKINK